LESTDLNLDDKPNTRRYYLPGEIIALTIVRELITADDWTFQDWAGVLPKGSVAILAAAQVLREYERSEAREILNQLVEEDLGTQDGEERAIHHAVRAEANAMLSRWREAEHEYRQAIDAMEDSKTRRSWWFNLANVAIELDDHIQRRAALEAALDVSLTDDISRRALELRRASEPAAQLYPGGTKAN
jgi:hypothetical protein